MKYLFFIAIALACPSACLADDWKLDWADEFNHDGLPDQSKWNYEEGFVRNGFHVYAIEWSPDQIKFFYDDQLYHTFNVKDADDKTGNPFHRPEYLLLNLAIGGSWGGTLDDSALPAQFLIDYVRVYRKGPTTQPVK